MKMMFLSGYTWHGIAQYYFMFYLGNFIVFFYQFFCSFFIRKFLNTSFVACFKILKSPVPVCKSYVTVSMQEYEA